MKEISHEYEIHNFLKLDNTTNENNKKFLVVAKEQSFLQNVWLHAIADCDNGLSMQAKSVQA